MSVGTGLAYNAEYQGKADGFKATDWAGFIVDRIMSGCSVHQSLAARSKCYNVLFYDDVTERPVKQKPWIETEAGRDDTNCMLASRLRFNVIFSNETSTKFGMNWTDDDIKDLAKMDKVEMAPKLKILGEKIAECFTLSLLQGFL